MRALVATASGGLNHRNGNFREDFPDDVHARNASNLGFGLHVDAVGDDLQGNALDVVGNHVVSTGDGGGRSSGLEQRLTGTRWSSRVR